MTLPRDTPFNPFDAMQRAVDIVGGSPHPENKIAASIAGTDKDGSVFCVSRTNFWPPAIETRIGRETRIGNSSGTVHAEAACILAAPVTEGAALFVTDPPCPNCVKNAIDAGIGALYIDHKGFTKDFAKRHGHHFTGLSMRLCEEEGIAVYELRRKEQTIIPIFAPAAHFESGRKNHSALWPWDAANDFSVACRALQTEWPGKAYACALVVPRNDKDGHLMLIGASADSVSEVAGIDGEGKYSPVQQPLNRVLMTAARNGLSISPDHVFSSRIPSSRELVNIVGAGARTLYIDDMNLMRDEEGKTALEQLQSSGVLKTITSFN